MLAVEPTPFTTRIGLTSSTGPLLIEVPPPAVAAVRVLDEIGAELRDVDEICWYGDVGGTVRHVTRDPRTQRFEIVAPHGLLTIESCDWDLVGQLTPELLPGRQELDLVLLRACGFVLRFRDGTGFVSWGSAVDPSVVRLDGEGGAHGWSTSSGNTGRQHRVSAPGLYRLTFPALEGYEPVPPVELMIEAGEFVPYTVDLVRKP
jgi:hypothetical protein